MQWWNEYELLHESSLYLSRWGEESKLALAAFFMVPIIYFFSGTSSPFLTSLLRSISSFWFASCEFIERNAFNFPQKEHITYLCLFQEIGNKKNNGPIVYQYMRDETRISFTYSFSP